MPERGLSASPKRRPEAETRTRTPAPFSNMRPTCATGGAIGSFRYSTSPDAVCWRSVRKGAANSGRTRMSLPVARSISAQVVLASTFTFPSAPVNRTCRSNRAPCGGSLTQVSAVTVSPADRLALLGRRDPLPLRARHLLDPLHPHRIVDVAELVDVGLGRGDGVGQAGHQLSTPNCHSTKACSSAASYKLSNRTDLPPCPAPMLVLSSSTLSSVLVARSFAAHLAGSQ